MRVGINVRALVAGLARRAHRRALVHAEVACRACFAVACRIAHLALAAENAFNRSWLAWDTALTCLWGSRGHRTFVIRRTDGAGGGARGIGVPPGVARRANQFLRAALALALVAEWAFIKPAR